MDGGRKSINKGKLLLLFLSSVWKHRNMLVVLAIAVMLMLLSWSVQTYDQSAAGEITLSYSNAFKGLNPNGTRFNIYDFTSDEMLEPFLEKTKLNGILSADELVKCISIEPSSIQSIEKRYISNVYTVRLQLPKGLPYRLSADNLLALLMDMYHESFNEKYALNRAALTMDWSYVDSMEYMEIYELATMRTQNITNFLRELEKASSALAYRFKAESFKSLINSVENFREIYIENFAAFIKVQRVFRNAYTYADKLNYKCLILNKDYEVANKLHTVYKKVLDDYDESVIAFVMVPMYDNKDGLYMARTSIGTDSLAIQSSGYNATSKALSEQITLSREAIRDAQNAVNSTENTTKADKMVQDIINQMEALIKRINTTVDEYQHYSSQSNIYCKLKPNSLKGQLQVKKNIVITCLVMFALSVLFAAIDIKRNAR